MERQIGGPEGFLAGIEPDAVLVEMSTIGRAAAREAARAVEARGARFVDAPVSGSVGPAERGELLALVGGADPGRRARDAGAPGDVRSRSPRGGGRSGSGAQGGAQRRGGAPLRRVREHAGARRAGGAGAGGHRRGVHVGRVRDTELRRQAGSGPRARLFEAGLLPRPRAEGRGAQPRAAGRGEVRPPRAARDRPRIAQAVADGLGDEDLFALEKYFASHK